VEGERAFEIDSNVGRYWLARAQGFDVVAARGRRVGVVKDVVVNPQTLEVSGVVLRRRPTAWGRPARVQIDELGAVVPGSRRFVLTSQDRPPRTNVWAAEARRQGVVAAQRTGHASAVAARHTGHALATGSAVVAAQTRSNWPTVRHGLAVAFRWTRQALAVAAAWTGLVLQVAGTQAAGFVRQAWRIGNARVRESELVARARAKRVR
jgi:sporulation protein YlmC with PRC-barrel domain